MQGISTEAVFGSSDVARLASAACQGDTKRVQAALAQGADVNAEGKDQVTPLVWALSCRNIDGVVELLKGGADPNKRGGVSPMWLAATYDDSAYIRALVEHGGSLIGVKDDRDTSTLLGAMTAGFQHGYWANYYFALNAGADLNIRYGPQPGITVAEKAVGLGLFDKTLELLDRGYILDLDQLERFARMRQVDTSSPQAKYKQELLDRLKEVKLGVR